MRLFIPNFFWVAFIFSSLAIAQNQETTFQDFIREHQGLAGQSGELSPLDFEKIDLKIRFYIEEKYPKIVDKIENILWDAYSTFSSNANRSHQHRFVAQVIVRGNIENKFIEVEYDPLTKKVFNQIDWSNEDQEFVYTENFLKKEVTKSNILNLEIANQTSAPTINQIIRAHQGFIDLSIEKNRGQNNIVPLDMKALNPLVSAYVRANYPEVDYTRNVTWNTYNTFISPYSSHHYHTFLAHVKIKGLRQTQYLEIFYNPMTNKINSDRKWDIEEKKFYKVMDQD